jgi:hypothetical protein
MEQKHLYILEKIRRALFACHQLQGRCQEPQGDSGAAAIKAQSAAPRLKGQ